MGRRFSGWLAVGGHLRRLGLMLVAVVAVGAGLGAYGAGLMRTLEGSSVDARFSIRGHERIDRNLVIVRIDDRTFGRLNLQWPFPRATHARLLARLAADRPAAVVMDLQFSEPSLRGQNDDLKLLRAAGALGGRAVFATTETDRTGDFSFMGSSHGRALLAAVGARGASALFAPGAGGVIRRVQARVNGLASISTAVAEIVGGTGATSHPGDGWIAFAGPSGTIPAVSYGDALAPAGTAGALPRHFFRNKIVVVGAWAPTLRDIEPAATDSLMTGAEIQANAIATVLAGMPLRSLPGPLDALLIVMLGVAVPASSLRLGSRATAAVALALAGFFLLFSQLAFDDGTVVSVVYPMIALGLSAVGSLVVQLATETFERIRVRDMFARFVPENVVEQVLADAGGLRLGGQATVCTVMFCDMRGFTTLCEGLLPRATIEFLNRFLTAMSEAILEEGGTVVSYMGDGILAAFGAPLPQPDHADRALRAAHEMIGPHLNAFNDWMRSVGHGDGVRIGVGLNTGTVVAGQVGSERRLEYTLVGDTANTASRIEGLTKGTPHQLLLAAATVEALHERPADLIDFGEVQVRGRSSTLRLFSTVRATDPHDETRQQGEPSHIPAASAGTGALVSPKVLPDDRNEGAGQATGGIAGELMRGRLLGLPAKLCVAATAVVVGVVAVAGAARSAAAAAGLESTAAGPASAAAAPASAAPASAAANPTGKSAATYLVTTEKPRVVGPHRATLLALVDPGSLSAPVTARFEYGIDPSYFGVTRSELRFRTAAATIPTGKGPQRIAAPLTGLLPHTIYRFRVVLQSGRRTYPGPEAAFTTAREAAPPPALGKVVSVTPTAGRVFCFCARSVYGGPPLTGKTAGTVEIPLTESTGIPVGSVIDTRFGALTLTSATGVGLGGSRQSISLDGGVFRISQVRSGRQRGLTVFTLVEGGLPGIPSYAGCRLARAAGPVDQGAHPPRKGRLLKRLLQLLHARDHHGRFATRGRYAAGAARGTEWGTADRCDGTIISVTRGKVLATNLLTQRRALLSAGQRLFARLR